MSVTHNAFDEPGYNCTVCGFRITGQHITYALEQGATLEQVRPVETVAAVRRSVACSCGAGAVLPTLRAANEWEGRHAAEGCEGCDHVVSIEDVKKR